MRKLILYFHTIKYLQFSQIYFRIYRKFIKAKVIENFKGELPLRNDRFMSVSLFDEKITTDLSATFLNHTVQLNLPHDWNDESHSKLWTYNLHYFEDLLAENAKAKHEFHIALLDRWLVDNPVGKGNGWEPYTISLRISNIMKAWQAGLPLSKRHFISLYEQASYLSTCLEKHLKGNHLLVNLKALLFAGIILHNNRWLKIAVNGLRSEISEQTLSDGANFELTPMYHSLILVDMLDMFNLCQAYRGSADPGLVDELQACIPKMLYFMSLMAHNDGGVSFFNDSVDGIAPSMSRIQAYATKLGFLGFSFDASKLQVVDASDSGYMIASNKGTKIIFDAANVGPDYIPGHAHADTLSFELSIGDERVFVNSGISKYGSDYDRLHERSTAAHNTVEVDGLNSSQVWSGFRVAKRAQVIDRSAIRVGETAVLKASHTGYDTIYNGPIHTRTLCLENGALTVLDELEGIFENAKARFYFHPNLKVHIENMFLSVCGENFELVADLRELKPRLVKAMWHPGFGLSQPNFCLECDYSNTSNSIKFSWI